MGEAWRRSGCRIVAVAVLVSSWCSAALAGTIQLEITAAYMWSVASAHTNYFNGRLLTANDFEDEQSYQRSSERYLGELPAALDAVFEPAGRADVVLLFDEADALFGKRTDVMDAHDRFADNFVLLDPQTGTWRGRLYVAGTDDTAEGVYDDLFGTFAGLTTVAAPGSLPLAALGIAVLGLAGTGARTGRRGARVRAGA